MKGNPFLLLALLGLLFLGTWGWGWAAVRILRRAGWDGADDTLGPALQVLLGMALFLSVGGFLVALDVAKFGVLLAWHIVGVVFLLSRVPGVVRRALSVGPLSWLRAVAIAAVGSVLALLAMGQAIGIQLYNPYDDDAAYVYLAKRLLDTGGLADPFNLRRITSFGGSALYQSLFLRVTGNASLRGFELMFALGVVLIVAVGTVRRRLFITGTFLLGIVLILGRGVGPVVNLSPEFSVAALSLGVYLLLRKIPLEHEKDQPYLYVVIGVLLAGILALRFYFLISVVAAVFFVIIALRGRRSLRGLALMAASAGIVSIGWAGALWRSSGTPVFPFLPGNYNTSWPSGNDPTLHGIGNFIHRYFQAFNGYEIGWVCVVAVAVAIVYLIVRSHDLARMVVLLGAGLGCLAQIVVISIAFSGSVPVDVTRFIAPSTLACGLLAIDALWPLRRAFSSKEPALSRRLLVMLGRVLGAAPLRIALAVGVAAIIFGGSVRGYWDNGHRSWLLGSQVLHGTIPMADRYAQFQSEYRGLNELIPRGARVLTAVDRPALLDCSRYRFATLDNPGAVSPPPHMPFFKGADAKVAYLRRLGYGYIAVDSPSESGLYRFRFLLHQLRSSVYFSREQAAYNMDWQDTMTSLEISGRYRVQRTGNLILIRIG